METNSDNINICSVVTTEESRELNRVLWEVLWEPFGLPCNVRDSFKLEGECIELAAKEGAVVVGGLVANFLSVDELELRHLGIKSGYQKKSVGSMLVKYLIETGKERGCSVIQTYARNTSVGFFLRLGFVLPTREILEHPDFSKHGITFQKMIYDVRQDKM